MNPSPRRPYTIVHTESSLGWGGQERRILSEALALRQRGHQVYLGLDPRGQLWPQAQAAGLPLGAFDFRRSQILSTAWRLRRWFQTLAADILNTHSSWDSWVATLAIAGLTRPRLIRTRHLSTPINNHCPTRFLYHRPAAIITTGQVINDVIHRATLVPRQRLHAIPTGVSFQEFFPHPPGPLPPPGPPPWPAGVFIAGMVAVLRSWKGHLYFLEALHLLREAGSPVYGLIVGEGPYRPVITAKIQELNLSQYVYCPGYQTAVAPWLAWMDVVVLPSYGHEGIPQALLQAMALAKPVVGTQCGGIPEIITPEVNGLLVPPRDSAALAAALARLRAHPGLRQACGAQGLALVTSRYSLAAMAQAVEQVYDAVLQESEGYS